MKKLAITVITSIILALFLVSCKQEEAPIGQGSISYIKNENDDALETIVLNYNNNIIESVKIRSKLTYEEMGVNSREEAKKFFDEFINDIQLIEGIKISVKKLNETYLIQDLSIDFSLIDEELVGIVFNNNIFVFDKNGTVDYLKTVKQLSKRGYEKLGTKWIYVSRE